MREHPLDRQMRLAGVGGAEHRGDAGSGCAIAREPWCWRESHIFRVFLLRPILARHCERSEAIHVQQGKYGLLRRFAPRNDEKLLGFPGAFAAECVSDCDAYQPIWRRFLRLRTSPERIAAESLTLPSNRFRSPQHLA